MKENLNGFDNPDNNIEEKTPSELDNLDNMKDVTEIDTEEGKVSGELNEKPDELDKEYKKLEEELAKLDRESGKLMQEYIELGAREGNILYSKRIELSNKLDVELYRCKKRYKSDDKELLNKIDSVSNKPKFEKKLKESDWSFVLYNLDVIPRLNEWLGDILSKRLNDESYKGENYIGRFEGMVKCAIYEQFKNVVVTEVKKRKNFFTPFSWAFKKAANNIFVQSVVSECFIKIEAILEEEIFIIEKELKEIKSEQARLRHRQLKIPSPRLRGEKIQNEEENKEENEIINEQVKEVKGERQEIENREKEISDRLEVIMDIKEEIENRVQEIEKIEGFQEHLLNIVNPTEVIEKVKKIIDSH